MAEACACQDATYIKRLARGFSVVGGIASSALWIQHPNSRASKIPMAELIQQNTPAHEEALKGVTKTLNPGALWSATQKDLNEDRKAGPSFSASEVSRYRKADNWIATTRLELTQRRPKVDGGS